MLNTHISDGTDNTDGCVINVNTRFIQILRGLPTVKINCTRIRIYLCIICGKKIIHRSKFIRVSSLNTSFMYTVQCVNG